MDRRGQAQAVVVLQPVIQEDHVRLGFPHFLEGLVDIRECGQDLETRLGVDHRHDPLAQHPVVVNEHQRDGNRHRTGPDFRGLVLLEPRATGGGRWDVSEWSNWRDDGWKHATKLWGILGGRN